MSAPVTFDRSAGAPHRTEQARPAFGLVLPPPSVAITGLVASMLFACAILLATTQLGSGDYGQWIMTSRPYAGLEIPAYRAGAAVPPVVPLLLGLIGRFVTDPVVAVHVVAVLLLLGLGIGVYLAAASLFDPLAGLLAAVAALLVTELFLQLFTFGGLLQAGAIVFLWLSVAALWRARRDPEHATRWLLLGSLCVGLGGLTHTGTASIAVPSGVAIAVLAVLGSGRSRQRELLRLLPLAAILALVAVYWVAFLLPGATDLARNPASLDYRGPGRLLETLTEYWPSTVVIGLGGVSLVAGAARELLLWRIGPWTALLAWTGVTLGVLGAAVVSGASTDYPRFVTPIMAPLVVAAAGGTAVALRRVARGVAVAARTGSATGWGVLAAGLLLVAATPSAVGGFAQEAHGYEVPDPIGLAGAAAWTQEHLAVDQVILAPAREGKWIEGMSGRGALFSNSVRYSFRPEEWQRSLAADTLLRSSAGAVANEFFFVKLTDAGAADGAARGLTIAANHGGEFVDLLTTVPSGTAVVDAGGATLATLANLAPATPGRTLRVQGDDALAATVWSGARKGATLTLHQAVSVHRGASTLELTLAVPDDVPAASLALALNAGGDDLVDAVEVKGAEANLTYRPLGSQAPRLRLFASGPDAVIEQLPNGRLVVRADGHQLRLLVTDLTGAAFPSVGLQALDPARLLDQYGVHAAVLQRDPALAARQRRLEGLGFRVVGSSGAYELLLRAAP